LRAEIAYLESPERLRVLSQQHLGLEPVSVNDVIQVKDIVVRFPLRETEVAEGEQ